MTPETEQRATQFIFTAGLLAALIIAVPGALTGFGIGWSAASARASVSTYQTTPRRTPAARPAPSPYTSPEPDYLHDVDALLGIRPRILMTGGITGRYKFIAIGGDRTLVAQVEIEGQGLDSVVFSWGQTIRAPIAMDADDQRALPDLLFTLTDNQLRALPAIIDRVLEDHATGTKVDNVTVHALLGTPQMVISLTHPRQVLEPVSLDLNGRPLPPR